jgi:type II secretory pathway component PulF
LRILANLLESGLSVGKTLVAFAELAPESWTPGITPMRDAVRDGKTLTAALALSPLNIPAVVLGMLHAGETGAGLGPAVRRAAELMERSAATRSAIRNALAYPVVLAVAGGASLTLLVGVVLPKFATILSDLGQTLPPTTQFVLRVTAMVRILAIPATFGVVMLWAAWILWTKTTNGLVRWHALLQRTPLIGPIRRSAATARTAAALASLLESGVPVAPAMIHAARAAGDAAAEQAVLETRERIVHGERLSAAVEAVGALTTTTIRLIRAGEESGQLAQMLGHAAAIEEERATQRVRAVVQMLEPTLILVFGGVVAFVAAALLQAVYSVRPTG